MTRRTSSPQKHGSRYRQVASGLVMILFLATGCEIADVGNLAVTWRFNDAPLFTGDEPCMVMFAETRPDPAGLIMIELTGKKEITDYVVCENEETEYPLSFYNAFADGPPDVYARVLKDLPAGKYSMRVSFINRHGNEVTDPAPLTRSVTVKRDKTTRIDLDFPLSYGRVNVRWSFVRGLTSCQDAGAAETRVRVYNASATFDQQTIFLCDDDDTDATPFTPVPPGTYRVEARLYDAVGQPVSQAVEAAAQVAVEAGVVADTAMVTFDATDLN